MSADFCERIDRGVCPFCGGGLGHVHDGYDRQRGARDSSHVCDECEQPFYLVIRVSDEHVIECGVCE